MDSIQPEITIEIVHDSANGKFDVWQTDGKYEALMMSLNYEDVKTLIRSAVVQGLTLLGGQVIEE